MRSVIPVGRPAPSGAAGAGWLPGVPDVVVAVAALLLDVLLFAGVGRETSSWMLLVLAVGAAPLAWRRRFPVAAFVLVTAVLALVTVLGTGLAPLAMVLTAVYAVASSRGVRLSLAVALAGCAVYTPAGVANERLDSTTGLGAGAVAGIALLYLFVFAVTWLAGWWTRRSRTRIATLEQERRAVEDVLATERRRLARELHDVVSHSVSVMVLQAAGARRVMAVDPGRADQALGQIEGLGKQSMTELRRLLGVLRDGAFVEGDDAALGPQPGLADLPALLAGFTGGGLVLRSETVGRPLPLDSSVDLSAYRIVQEALTNAHKHAGEGARVTVRQTWAADVLMLEVVDDGRGSGAVPELSMGFGLLGLRERVRAVGGRLDAGAVAGGGFRISATLPARQTGTVDVRGASVPASVVDAVVDAGRSREGAS